MGLKCLSKSNVEFKVQFTGTITTSELRGLFVCQKILIKPISVLV